MAVVVLDIEMQDANKLPTPSDQEMVQALPAHGANPALGDGIGVRSLNGTVAPGDHRRRCPPPEPLNAAFNIRD
jgi:hypothetical protein